MAPVWTAEKKRHSHGSVLWSDMRRWKVRPVSHASALRFIAVAKIHTMSAVAIHSERRPLCGK